MAHLDWHDGFLCVVETTGNYSEPKIVDLWWPVAKLSAFDCRELIGREVVGGASPDWVYRARDGYNGWYAQRFPLLNGGQTKAIKTEERSIPCPKVRKTTETRWHSGRWEKYLKTQGWVVAEASRADV